MANKGKIELKSTVTDTQCHQDRPTITAALNIPSDSLVTGIDRPTVMLVTTKWMEWTANSTDTNTMAGMWSSV